MFVSPCLAYIFTYFSLFSIVHSQGDPNASACQTLNQVVSICESLTPGFTAFTNFYFQAPCLCYSSTYWRPDPYDNLIQSCYAGYRTAEPSAYASATASMGADFVTTPCHRAGNFLTLPQATGSQTIIPSRTITPVVTTSGVSGVSSSFEPNRLACQTISVAESYCFSKSPGFVSFTDFRSEAPCFCYSGLVWNPSYYDSAWGSCVQYLSTAATATYSRLLSAGAPVLTSTPCAAVGDILDVRSTVNPGSSPLTASAAKTGSSGQPAASATTTRIGSNGAGEFKIETRRILASLLVSCFILLL